MSTQLGDNEFPALVRAKEPVQKPSGKPLPSFTSTKISEIIEIPNEERKIQDDDPALIEKRQATQFLICRGIVKDCGVDIEYTKTKSNGLRVIITGQGSQVAKAKRGIIEAFQTHETIKVNVPRSMHGFLIGRRGERLREIEATTITRITIPPPSSADPDNITITGPKKRIVEAERIIRAEIEKEMQQGYQRLEIPKEYHPFVCGPGQRIIDDIRTQTSTKISVPPIASNGTVFTISGKREDVTAATAQLQALIQEAEATKTIVVKIERSQHRLIMGHKGSGIFDIRAQTGVSVELPYDPEAEDIVLRGKPENLGKAMSMVYEKAASATTEEVLAPNRLHPLIIGKSGSNLNELREGYEKVRIDFGDNKNAITVAGPPEEVAIVVQRLKTRIDELEKTFARATIKVDPKFHRHIVGRQGATISRMRDFRVRVTLPAVDRASHTTDEIIIEGDPDGVVKAKEEIKKMVERLENEKHKDVIIEPEIQRLLYSGRDTAPPPIRTIYDAFPKVSIHWPAMDSNSRGGEPNGRPSSEPNPSQSVVQLRGDRQQVDAAAEQLQKLIKTVLEENYRQEIKIFKEFRPQILGRGSSKLKKLLDETKTHVQYPNPADNSDMFTIIGREESVREAIKQLEEMQKKLANIKEVIVKTPPVLRTKYAGNFLRSVREECPDVHIRFLHPASRKSNDLVEIVIMGPTEGIEKAQKFLDQLSAKVSEMVAEEIVRTDPRFHGMLIGRHGATITRFRDRHNVELMFPDRCEQDPKLARQIRIVGPKEAVKEAKADLEGMIKSLEDEIEESIEVESALIKDITQFRRAFPDHCFDNVRLIIPRANPSGESSIKIKLIGSKANVEAARQVLEAMITSIRQQITKEYPISDPNHIRALERARAQFRELEQQHTVYISLLWQPAGAEPSTEGQDEQKPTLYLTGTPDKIEELYEMGIKPLLPVDEEFFLPQEFHRSLIVNRVSQTPANTSKQPKPSQQQQQKRSKRGGAPVEETNGEKEDAVPPEMMSSKATEMQRKYGVYIRLPPQTTTSDYINLRCLPSQLDAVKEELSDWLKECEELKADRLARAYELMFPVPSRFVSNLLNLRQKFVQDHNVGMRIDNRPKPTILSNGVSNGVTTAEEQPEEDVDETTATTSTKSTEDSSAEDQESQPQKEVAEEMATVVLRGYKENATAAREAIEEAIKKFDAQITESLHIPAEVHPQLIGAKGTAIQRTMQEFNVKITFPNRMTASSEEERNTVYVTGDETDVDNACNYLVNRANDVVQRRDSEKPQQRKFQQSISDFY